MLASGLFDDAPRTREVMAITSMRLRALRVEVDVRLALGELDIASAASYMRRAVPMDDRTASEEAAFFAAAPGLALAYQGRQVADPAVPRRLRTRRRGRVRPARLPRPALARR